jgi:NADP-dependent 3-hydroxy acid dehydrogenase YdfG
MSFELKERFATVLVGAASGMGLAVAERLAAGGRRLVLADRAADHLNVVADRLGAEAVTCDVTNAATVHRLADHAGQTSTLVITAGLSPTMGTFHDIVTVNLGGTASLLSAFEPKMVAGGV